MKRISVAIALLALGLAGCNAAKPTPSSTPLESLITGGYQFQFIVPLGEGVSGIDWVYEVNVTANTACGPTCFSTAVGGGILGIELGACASYDQAPPPTGCVTIADANTLVAQTVGANIQGSVNGTTIQMTVPYSATGTQTANGFSGTWSSEGVSGTWFATKAITFPAAATFTGSEGQWTMSVSGTTATLSNPDTSYNCTVAADSLVCPYPKTPQTQNDACFIVIPDSTVPSGFDLAWIGNDESSGFIELLTDQN